MPRTIICGICKTEQLHYAKELCEKCWMKEWRKENIKNNPEKYKMIRENRTKRQREKYWGDSAYREKTLVKHREYSKKWFRRKCEKNPEWNKNRQKEFRRLHPETFNKCMAKFYLNRMTTEERLNLLMVINREESEKHE